MAHPHIWLETDSPQRQAWLAQQIKQTEQYFAHLPHLPAWSEPIPSPAQANQSPAESIPNPAGDFVAYSLPEPNSVLQRWRVCSAQTEPSATAPFTDEIGQVYASGVVWDTAGQGFFYNRFWEWPGFHALYYHRLGTDQAADQLIYQQANQPTWFYLPQISPDGRYLLIAVLRQNDWRNCLLVQALQPTTAPLETTIQLLIPHFRGRYDFICTQGSRFFLREESEAYPQGRVIALDMATPSPESWQEIIPQKPFPLKSVIPLADGQLALHYLKSACAHIELVTLSGQYVADVPLPNCGTVDEMHVVDDHLRYTYSDFSTPPTEYRYHPRQRTPTISPSQTPNPSPSAYKTEQICYPSGDGELISMFLTYKHLENAPLARNGHQPIYLYGYGGFGKAITPHFSAEMMAWLDLGGVYAVVNLRGGGEYGRNWHRAAVGHRKQRTFDDCLAAAQWLIDQHYTCPARLALGGQSNGGLTAAVCLSQRPDLFGAVIIEAGLTDMLRFDQLGLGADWRSEYGSPHRPEDRAVLEAYSPLHRLKANTRYPATLIITHAQDPYVGEAHSFKFTAALQAAQVGESPILLQIIPGQGHCLGPHEPEMARHKVRFLATQLKLNEPQ